MPRRSPQHLAVVVDGERRVTEALAFHLGQFQSDGVPGGDFVGSTQHPDQVVAQLFPAFRGSQKLLQRRRSQGVVGIDFQNRAQ